MYGITFIIIENTALTSISFAQNILDASFITQTPGKVIAIAIAANTFCCLLHAFSRKWGIIFNTFFGTVKFFMLLFFVIIGLAWTHREVAYDNFNPRTAFDYSNSPRLPYRYAEAYMWVALPFTAFHQINYVSSTSFYLPNSQLEFADCEAIFRLLQS